jgi:hypothetical protein
MVSVRRSPRTRRTSRRAAAEPSERSESRRSEAQGHSGPVVTNVASFGREPIELARQLRSKDPSLVSLSSALAWHAFGGAWLRGQLLFEGGAVAGLGASGRSVAVRLVRLGIEVALLGGEHVKLTPWLRSKAGFPFSLRSATCSQGAQGLSLEDGLLFEGGGLGSLRAGLRCVGIRHAKLVTERPSRHREEKALAPRHRSKAVSLRSFQSGLPSLRTARPSLSRREPSFPERVPFRKGRVGKLEASHRCVAVQHGKLATWLVRSLVSS